MVSTVIDPLAAPSGNPDSPSCTGGGSPSLGEINEEEQEIVRHHSHCWCLRILTGGRQTLPRYQRPKTAQDLSQHNTMEIGENQISQCIESGLRMPKRACWIRLFLALFLVFAIRDYCYYYSTAPWLWGIGGLRAESLRTTC